MTTRYPVIVTETVTHVVWAEADSAEEAAGYVNEMPWDYIDTDNDMTVAEADVEAHAPEYFEIAELVYGPSRLFGYSRTITNDAHVVTHKIAMINKEHQIDKAVVERAMTRLMAQGLL